MNWRQQLTEQSSGFTGLELIGDLVLLLAKAEGLIAIELYFADAAADDNGVNWREKGHRRE